MAINVTFNGTTYTIPSPGDSDDWGTLFNAFLVAIAAARPGTEVVASTVNGTAVNGTASGASGVGVGGTAVGSSGYGVHGQASSTSVGVRGSATNGAGVLGVASGSGEGLHGISASGYGSVAEGDTTSPAHSAFRVVPQDTQPSGPNLVGDIYVTTAGLLKICTVAGSPGTWVSVGAQ